MSPMRSTPSQTAGTERGALPAAEPRSRAPPLARTSGSGSTLRIMLVEDEAVIAALLGEVLAGLGYEICAIEATEAGAVAAADRCKPDLMIVDARLRVGSGVSAVATILRAGFVPHIFISGDTAKIHALNPGTVVLQKPFHINELARAIERTLDRPAGL
jgi:two-component system, response regulator PdtaR